MKGLDTSVLLGLLEGDSSVLRQISRLRGVELATTEVNLLELALIAGHGPARAQRSRRGALERLRRKLTVLPIDGRAIDLVTRRLDRSGEASPPLVLAMLGALESSGCDELFVRDPLRVDSRWKLKVTRIADSHPKTSA